MSTLSPGARLGQYEVIAPLGAGGMGEVFRARDTKLGRDVALKILPEHFTKDAERVARFQREAQLLASLNHPHIGAIYGLEEAQASQFLVLELVEGETLAARITGTGLETTRTPRPIPCDEALAIARQIADALEAAHEKGIVHRDLKPANIALTHDGQVKILDFGLAKSVGEGSRTGAQGDLSPTLTFAATQAGVILGTAAYMSPEQAKGRAADKRTDVWAFGCVLFEMLTGTRAFPGEDVTDIIAAVVRGEPNWTALPSDVPDQIRLLLKRCLEKDRRARVSDIGVAKFLMTETIDSGPAKAGPHGGAGRRESVSHDGRKHLALGGAFGLIVGAAAAVVALAILPRSTAGPATPPARFTITPGAEQALGLIGENHHVAITPDGAHIIYTALAPVKNGAQSVSQLAVRGLNELEGRLLDGANGVEPFLSPDGQWIGFFSLGQIRKVSISGGPPITICTVPANTIRGASWGDDGTIVFAVPDSQGGLASIAPPSCEMKALTHADPVNAAAQHSYPVVLPGSRHILYTIAAGTENAQLAVLDRQTGQSKIALRGGSDAKYVDPSPGPGRGAFLVYAAAGSLRAVRFDLAKLDVVGDPFPVVNQVVTEPTGEASFGVSREGTLVYVPGSSGTPAMPMRSLVWVNRQGREEPINAPPRPYALPRLSPDGTRVALDVRDHDNDIWIFDLARQTLTPVNLNPAADMSPVWMPDGKRVLWASTRDGNPSVYVQAADGTGTPERLTISVAAQFPTSVSPDGTKIVGHHSAGQTSYGSAMDLSILALDTKVAGLRKPEPLLQSAAAKFNPEISPDGRWMAYQSNESGRAEIYVRPFPNVESGRYQISSDGGSRPAWARSGKELFYLDANDLLTSVPVQMTATTFNPGRPARILNTKYYAGASTRGLDLRGYDVSADGQRFLMVKEGAALQSANAPPASMVVVLNWLEDLKQKVR